MKSPLSLSQRRKQLADRFGCKRPIIGMIHLPTLPGSPNAGLSVEEIISFAISEYEVLARNGINAILVENFNDYPFVKESVHSETIACFSIIMHELMRLEPKIPIGINLLRNACLDALSIALVTKADFIRCNFFTGAYVTDQGIIEGCARELRELLQQNNSEDQLPMIFADVHCKHAAPLTKRAVHLEALDALERGLADAIIISGDRTGLPANKEKLLQLREKNIFPVLLGSGVDSSNIHELLPLTDGAIIGTALKEDGAIAKPISGSRVAAIMKKAKQYQ
jgi:hypothetical protein